ncbi:DMT family protein [Horticoccus luteus]|uniref:DMT family protein n=1 Tax=Horticoccus luteus TaxID=2862869 RepID=A0A8F9XJS1_9BACT|nr:DMT family protein [Horticoccus luteus]QYM78968.1 DMT family protein [Horticoccus luteus]
MKTVLLLVCSNVFMTIAWYGQLKFKFFEGKPLITIIVISWAVAFFEYCFMIPANRSGYANGLTGYQLKVIQECVTLSVFAVFAWVVLKEKVTWNYAVSFLFLILAVYFATAFKPAATPVSH